MGVSPIFEWELQDPKMELLYHIFGHILWGSSVAEQPYHRLTLPLVVQELEQSSEFMLLEKVVKKLAASWSACKANWVDSWAHTKMGNPAALPRNS